MLSNAESIGQSLISLAPASFPGKAKPLQSQSLLTSGANIRNMSESIDELVRDDADLTQYPGIGKAIAEAIREIS